MLKTYILHRLFKHQTLCLDQIHYEPLTYSYFTNTLIDGIDVLLLTNIAWILCNRI